MESTGGYTMAINEDMLVEANKIVSDSKVSLPVEIPGFPGFFVAEAIDTTVQAIGAFVSETNRASYKIGTRSAS